jgi:lipopolysaccharide export system permease protein
MIKRLDKFILARFLGPFILAYAVVTFIFLIQHLIRYFKYFVGKDLGWEVFAELFTYFALMLTPVALPLSVLLSALMSFGSLGEHSELTAIKSSGISLTRILRPVGAFVILLTLGAVYFNDIVSPEANLKSYSLLYDIKQKKPTLEFKEGVFYDGLPGYSIRIERKSGEDGRELEELMIYNHTSKQGNTDLIMAERGRMYTTHNGNYLVLEMIKGRRYTDLSAEQGRRHEREFLQNEFDSSQIVFSMESFGLKETKKELFKGHNMMKTASQLRDERDSVAYMRDMALYSMASKAQAYYLFQFEGREAEAKRPTPPASMQNPEQAEAAAVPMDDGPAPPVEKAKGDSIITKRQRVWNAIPLSPIGPQSPLAEYWNRRGHAPYLMQEAAETTETAETAPSKAGGAADSLLVLKPGKIPRSLRPGEVPNLDAINASLLDTGSLLQEAPDSPPRLTAGELAAQQKAKDRQRQRTAKPASGDVRQLRQEQAALADTGGSTPPPPPAMHPVEAQFAKLGGLRANFNQRILNLAWSKSNGIKIAAEDVLRRQKRHEQDMVQFQVELHNRYARSMAVFIMFLIGAPLGAIIKKGGLGVPILISILFFIIYYITTITGTKLANSQVIPPIVGAWGGDALLLACGLFFLKKAYQDSRLLDFDYYSVAWDRLKAAFKAVQKR